MQFNTFIGIDISKATLDFSLRDCSSYLFHIQVPNSAGGIREFTTECKNRSIDLKTGLFCMEHTGLYNNILLSFITRKGYSSWLEQGIQIKQSLGVQRGKNDKVDSERICEYAYRFQDKCRLWEPPREIIVRIKKLTTLRRRLIKSKVLLKVAMKEDIGFEESIVLKETQTVCNPVIKKIEEQLIAIDRRIKKHVEQDPYLNDLFQIIVSVDGVGPVTAYEIIITTNEFKQIKEAKKYACYAGVVPFEHSSGSSIRGKTRVNRMANKTVKQLLHMSALSATVMKGEMNDYYNRKVSEGKNKMAVLNAIRNKLVLRIFACVRDGRKYEKTNMVTVV